MARQQYPIIERHGDVVTVTARSTVEAQQVASDALGTDCTLTSVEKVHEGGIGGFFATELVRVTARPSRGEPRTEARVARRLEEMDAVLTSAEDLMSSLRAKAPEFADRLLEEWARDAQVATPEPAAPIAVPVAAVEPPPPPPPLVVAPAPVSRPAVPAAPVTVADRRWSHHVLRAMGIPDPVVDVAARSHPATESEWIVALMGALRDLCAPAAAIPTIMVGPACANLARQLRLVSVAPEELLDSVSSVAVPHVSARAVAASLNGRVVHLVVGGAWQHLGALPVRMVSAASPADLLEALRVGVAWGASLGWYWSGDRYERIDEFTVVSHIRTLLCAADPVVVPA
jgi:hypothetical protein